MKLNIKTSTPLLAFRCLDGATMIGDHHVDHHYNFLKEYCIDFEKAEEVLEQYKQIFLEINKKEHGYKNLFEFANVFFDHKNIPEELVDIFAEFLGLKLSLGTSTIFDYFQSKLPLIETYLGRLEKEGKLFAYKAIIDKACSLFPFSDNKIEVDAFITWSPHDYNVQGSAYSVDRWMFVETNEYRLNNLEKDPVYLILHEYVHLALNILMNVDKEYPDEIDWNSKRDGYNEPEKLFFDEAITYCLVDLIIAGKNSSEALVKYKSQKDVYKIRVIELAIKFKSKIEDYLNGKISDKDEVVDSLFDLFRQN